MPPRKRLNPQPVVGDSPPTEPDLSVVLQEALGKVLPTFAQDILGQVEAKLPRIPDEAAIVNKVSAALSEQMTQKLNEAVGRIQAQVNEGLAAHRQTDGAAPATNLISTAPAPSDPAEKVVSATARIVSLVDGLLDTTGPKLLNLLGTWQLQQMFKLANPEHAAALRQANPQLAQIIGQQLVGPNPYEMALPDASLHGVAQGMRIMASMMKDTKWLESLAIPSSLAPSTSSSGAPLSPSLPTSGPRKPAGSVSMTNVQDGGHPQTKPRKTLSELLA